MHQLQGEMIDKGRAMETATRDLAAARASIAEKDAEVRCLVAVVEPCPCCGSQSALMPVALAFKLKPLHVIADCRPSRRCEEAAKPADALAGEYQTWRNGKLTHAHSDTSR